LAEGRTFRLLIASEEETHVDNESENERKKIAVSMEKHFTKAKEGKRRYFKFKVISRGRERAAKR
jgi:hypothetical protein